MEVVKENPLNPLLNSISLIDFVIFSLRMMIKMEPLCFYP